MDTGELLEQPDRMLGSTLQWTSIPSWKRGVEILLAASCYKQLCMSQLGLRGFTSDSFFTNVLSILIVCNILILRSPGMC